MAALNSITAHNPKLRSFERPTEGQPTGRFNSTCRPLPSIKLRRSWPVRSVTGEREAVALEKSYSRDSESEKALSAKGPDVGIEEKGEGDEVEILVGRGINAAIVLGVGTLAVTKLLTIDHDYWPGWTLYEILSGVVYALGDWIAQCIEGKPLFEFDRVRMIRSGLVGFTLHGSLSHYYYQFCKAIFPFQGWWVVPSKVAFDQTVWAAIWNSIYYVALGFLRFKSPSSIFRELKATFWLMLTAGWKLWPFAHLVTYGLIPVEQRLLRVDCVELIWVTSRYSQPTLIRNRKDEPLNHLKQAPVLHQAAL